MDSLVVILIVAAVLAVAALSLIVVRRPRKTERKPARVQQASSAQAKTDLEPGIDYAPGINDDATVAKTTIRRTIDDVPLPEVQTPEILTPEILTPDSQASEIELPTREIVEPAEGRFARLRGRVRSGFGARVSELLGRGGLDQETWDEIEESLLLADVGLAATSELISALKARVRGENGAAVLREELTRLIDGGFDRSLGIDGSPAVVLVVGVNGTGKTTTTGKIARLLTTSDKSVLLGAADTFRAAAVDQLTTWGERVGAKVVRGPESGDPASVAFDAVNAGIADGADVVLIDTAGRLHTKAGLMDELGKVKRVIEKAAPVTEVLLVLDATTGQNGLTQAKVFAEVVDVTGVVLTKLDGSARGGIVISVQRELGVPVKLVGLGEGPDDLAPFDPSLFVDALLS